MYKGRGIIATFDTERYDEYVNFSRIGESSIGGKARGLAFLSTLIKKYPVFKSFEDVIITIPRTVVLGVDIFEAFMDANRSEERRVGKECRYRWWPGESKKR